MEIYFGPEWHGKPFELFGASHIGLLVVVTLLTVAVVWLGPRMGEQAKATIRWGAGVLLLVNTLFWHIWNVAVGLWSVEEMLPLHLCSVMTFVSAAALFTQQRLLSGLAWLLGTTGASAALLMSEVAPYEFPHYRVIQSWLQHTLLWLAGFWLVFAEGIRPTWRVASQAWIVLHAYLPIVFIVNLLVGSNYLFINRKPEFATVIDALPAWPGYLIALEVLVVIVIAVFTALGQIGRGKATTEPGR